MPQVFISYSRVDSIFTDQFVERLQQAFPNLIVWRDKGHHGLVGGDNWWNEILKAIEDSDIFIYILSNESIQSLYCQAEFTEARRLRKRIITVQARDKTELTDDLGDIQFIDMKDGVDSPASLMRLNAAIHKQLGLAKRLRPQWTPKTARPGKEKLPVRDANSPDVTTPPLAPPLAEQDALKVAKAGLRWQIILGIAAILVTLLVGVLPLISEQSRIASETAVAMAKTQTVLDLTPTPNPVQKVQTLDAQATEQEALLAVTRDNMTAQARLDAIASGTAQGTVDAEATAFARMDSYATLTALASFTPSATKTPTPTKIPTITPTTTLQPSPTPLPTSAVLGKDAIVTFHDDFDGTSLSSQWKGSKSRVELQNSEMIYIGRENWGDELGRGNIQENEGILILFKFDIGSNFIIYLQKGDFTATSGRAWAVAINEYGSSIESSSSEIGSVPLGHSRTILQANTWYYLLTRVTDGGHFYTQIWRRDDPSKFIVNINPTRSGDDWDNGDWYFNIQMYSGTFRADLYEELRFPENYVMPSTPPN